MNLACWIGLVVLAFFCAAIYVLLEENDRLHRCGLDRYTDKDEHEAALADELAKALQWCNRRAKDIPFNAPPHRLHTEELHDIHACSASALAKHKEARNG